MIRIPFLFIVLSTFLLAPKSSGGEAGDRSAASKSFAQLIDHVWEFDLEQDPLRATRIGDDRFNDLLPDESLEAQEKRLQAKRDFRQRLQAIDRESLPAGDRMNYDIFARMLDEEIAEYEFDSHLIPITNRSGFHVSFPELPKRVPLKDAEDYQDYIARLRAFDQYVKDHIELLRAGLERGMTLPSVTLEGYQESIKPHIVNDPAGSLLYAPLKDFPATIAPEQRRELERQGRKAIEESVAPGYRRFLEFMKDEYVPAARGAIGASALPRGREFYRHRVRRFTTLDLTPEEVHHLGLAQVERIKKEMHEVIREVEFDGDFEEFVEFLRTDPKFYAETPEQLLKEAAYILKRMEGALPKLFKTLPRTPCGLREVPSYIAPRTTTAYYSPPAGDGSDAGYYYVNTYNLKARPLYGLQALSLHEAVPGHHLQLALQQEMDDLPKFRRFSNFTAFIEGWALYAERLGLEVGFYEDPYSDFGRLTYEMWRACRLVVDTGIHYLGWSRQQAIEYMAENTALSRHNIEAEVDRYIAWPGQALAYKMGELKIRELRDLAEKRLGDDFDVRLFHDEVLRGGSVPLSVLDSNITAWIEKQTQR